MKTVVNPIDPVTIVEASEELLDLLEIDAIVRAQLKKWHFRKKGKRTCQTNQQNQKRKSTAAQ